MKARSAWTYTQSDHSLCFAKDPSFFHYFMSPGTGADPGFLEREFIIMYKRVGGSLW